jgi:RNA polymerase sigma factor (sigma-70 family)
MDHLLLPLLNAVDEQELQQRVEELLVIHVRPIIRQMLQQRLGLYVNAQGVNATNHDAEDLYQEAMARMVEVLHADRRLLTTIENFEGYVGRIVTNICVDFLRSKHPTRARLRDALQYVLRRHADLVSWQYDDELLCGFAAWRNTRKRAVDVSDIDTRLNAFLAARFADEDVRVARLSRVVRELFEWIGGPVEIDVLVRMLAYVRDIREQQTESLDDADFENSLRSHIGLAESDVETHELLGQLWRIVRRLTPKQRDAFALRFCDQDGRNLFTVLLAAGIVDWKDLAEGMGRSAADVARLWKQMPMDSATVARELRTSRDNVYKWRFRALQKLKAELE